MDGTRAAMYEDPDGGLWLFAFRDGLCTWHHAYFPELAERAWRDYDDIMRGFEPLAGIYMTPEEEWAWLVPELRPNPYSQEMWLEMSGSGRYARVERPERP